MNEKALLSAPRWPYGLAKRHVDHVVIAWSDIEMGAGGVRDDFPQSTWLAELMLAYCTGPFADVPLTLVFNGDTFDLLKTSLDDETFPTHIDEEIALQKLRRVSAAHPEFFTAVRQFLAHREAPRRVAFVVGNHDPELTMPAVQREIRELCGEPDPEQLAFPGLSMRIGDVHLEHGCQADPLFAFDPDALTLQHEDRELLNLPWGSVALLEVAIPLTPLLYHHDRIKPRDELLERIPELKRLLIGAFWRYWTRDYWQRYFAEQDPLRRMSWTMLREVVYRLATGAMDVSLNDTYHRLVKANDDVQVCIIGHSHEAGWHTRGRKKLLQTGCFRNEFAMLDSGERQELLPKVYAEAYQHQGRTVRSHLVEIDAPPPPPGYVPDSLFSVAEPLRELLEQRNLAADNERAARERQEAKEARDARGRSQPWAHRFDFLRTLQRALATQTKRPEPPTEEP